MFISSYNFFGTTNDLPINQFVIFPWYVTFAARLRVAILKLKQGWYVVNDCSAQKSDDTDLSSCQTSPLILVGHTDRCESVEGYKQGHPDADRVS